MTKVENIAKEIIKESKDENEIELFRKYPKVYYSTEKDDGISDDQRIKYKEHSLRFLELIIEIKNLDLA